MTEEEMKAIEKYQAHVRAEMWCDPHGVSKTHIRETDTGYQVVKEFKF